jgi:hypothetical protein
MPPLELAGEACSALETPAVQQTALELLDQGRRLVRFAYDQPVAIDPAKTITADEARVASEIAAKAVKRVASWYKEVPQEIGTHLTDPNVVLTLGDARGQTEICARHLDPLEGRKEVEHLNELANKDGIQFKFFQMSKNKHLGGTRMHVVSPAGLERTTSQSRLVPQFVADSGETPWQWLRRAKASLESTDSTTLNDRYRFNVAFGALKGYPDDAVKSYAALSGLPMDSSRIKFAGYYPCPQPSFFYDRDFPDGVQSVTNIWGRALEEFYRSPEHIAIKAEPAFISDRLLDLESLFRDRQSWNPKLLDRLPQGKVAEIDAWLQAFYRSDVARANNLTAVSSQVA